MRIKSVHYEEVDLIPAQKFITSLNSLKSRPIIYLKFIDEKDNYYIGEAAPLPSFATENYSECLVEIRTLATEFTDKKFPKSTSEIESITKQFNKLPSLKYSLEQIFYSYLIINNYLSVQSKSVFHSEALGINSINILTDQIKYFSSMGISTFKLKIGRDDFNSDLKIINSIRNQFSDINLRLDVNGKWSLANAIKNIERLQNIKLDYIEQPVRSSIDLIKLSQSSPIKIAVDETLPKLRQLDEFVEQSKIKYFILKPGVIGSIGETRKYISQLNSRSLIPVLSSSLESNFGKLFLLFTAYNSNKGTHGFGPLNMFTNNISKFDLSTLGKINFRAILYEANQKINNHYFK